MHGVMFLEKGVSAIIKEEKPALDSDSMLLKTVYSGLSNGTERSFLMDGNYGHSLPYPKRIAYQHVSTVVACGENITRFKVNDTVFSSTFPGHVQYHTVRENDLLIKLDDSFDLECAALFGVASVALHNVRRAKVSAADHVLVLGDGLIGQFVAQCARASGASVVMGGHHKDRLAIAQSTGTDHVINTRRSMKKIEKHAPYSVIFECSGADVIDDLLPVFDRSPEPRLVLTAGRFDVRYNFNRAGALELTVLHSQHFRQDDLETVAALVKAEKLHIRPLIRDVVPFNEAVAVFDTLRDAPSKLLGTVFAMP